MKLNGAFEPQQGASLIESSIGAKKYRDKQCDNESNNNVAFNCVCALRNNNNCNNYNNNNNLNIVMIRKVKIEDWTKAPQNIMLQQKQQANIKSTKIVANCGNTTCLALKHVSEIIETGQYNQNNNNDSNTNYNINKLNNQVNTKSSTNVQKSIRKATTTTIDMLLHTIAVLLSFSNYNVSLYCTTWLRTCNIKTLLRVPQTLLASNDEKTATTTTTLANAIRSRLFGILNIKMAFVMYLCSVIMLLPCHVLCDESDILLPANSMEIETTTPEFDYASRGQKKFGDKCDNTLECGFPGSICDPKKRSCQCTEDLPVTNHFDKCGKEAAINESCFFNEQCEVKYFQTECRDNRCVCRFEMTPVWAKDGTVECSGRQDKRGNETYIDPAMIGVLLGMALMFVIICVVLRLFSQARWRENRTIFNTPNPRLMNVSLLRESKLLHGQERRGSRMSVRAPSRQPSMASLRPHSPNPSLGKTGRMTRSKSNTRSSDSRVSDVSNCSRLLEHPTATHASHTHANTTHTHYAQTSTTHPQNSSTLTTSAATPHITTYVSSPGASSACGMPMTAPPTVSVKTNKF